MEEPKDLPKSKQESAYSFDNWVHSVYGDISPEKREQIYDEMYRRRSSALRVEKK